MKRPLLPPRPLTKGQEGRLPPARPYPAFLPLIAIPIVIALPAMMKNRCTSIFLSFITDPSYLFETGLNIVCTNGMGRGIHIYFSYGCIGCGLYKGLSLESPMLSHGLQIKKMKWWKK